MVYASTEEEEHICSTCQSVSWLDLARKGEPGQVVMTIDISRNKLQQSRCHLCRLISTIMPCKTLDTHRRSELTLFSIKTALEICPTFFGSTDYTEGRCLAFSDIESMRCWRDGFLALSDPSEQSLYEIRPVNPDKVDFGFIQGCLTQCREAHGHNCNLPVGSAPSNLRVIDCQLPSPDVTVAPGGCQYAALSYVWGSPHTSVIRFHTFERFSPVVSDAIMATRLLGMRYLWVDRYVRSLATTSRFSQLLTSA